MEPTKSCSYCKNTLPLSLFRKDSRLKSGIGTVCKSCSREKALQWRNANVERARSNYKKWAANNKEHNTQRKLSWAKANPEKAKESDRASYSKNCEKRTRTQENYRRINKETLKLKAKEWRLNNMGYVLAKNKERELVKISRVPKWLTKEDLAAIKKIYEECRKLNEAGGDFHVDHEVPLRGATVSGLHTPNNLRILSAAENCKKKNKFSDW
jgi:hypothetical protein